MVDEVFPEDFYVYDKENVLDYYKEIHFHIKTAYKSLELLKFDFNASDFDTIVFAGMGGSAISGMLIKDLLSWFKVNARIIVHSDYNLPANLPKKTLVICTSYSGNTEETLSAYKQAHRNFFKIISISSGGKLKDLAKNYKTPHIDIPKGFHPRNALPYLFIALLRVFELLGFIKNQSSNIDGLVAVLRKKSLFDYAVDISKKLVNKRILIYSSSSLYSIAYRWKTQFNENSKVPAFVGYFPELCHNEICQFMFDLDDFFVIILNDQSNSRRMLKRISITKKLISKHVDLVEIDIKGDNPLVKMFSAVVLGDLISLFLALLNKRDPADDSIIGSLKKELGPWIN